MHMILKGFLLYLTCLKGSPPHNAALIHHYGTICMCVSVQIVFVYIRKTPELCDHPTFSYLVFALVSC